MNKQKKPIVKKTLRYQLTPTSLGIIFILVVLLAITSSFAFAQSSSMKLAGNDTLELTCDGRGFAIERISRKELFLTCQPSKNAPVEPTVAPPEPTTTPPEPTIVPPEPTAAPPEPTVAPPQPTVAPPQPTPSPPPVTGNIHYISKNGNNSDGTSWATAWSELNQVNWNVVKPGDVVLIDGGAEKMVYTTTLEPTASGTAAEPIRIQLATEPGRNGQAAIFGGRSTPLPYCGETNYSYQTDGVLSYGIRLKDTSWVIIDGTKWQGISINGVNRYGIRFYPSTNNITIRNLELYDNGYASSDGGSWTTGGKGISLQGASHTLSRLIIHDNGQDAVQSNGDNVSNRLISESWFYNLRQHPTVNESFNYCTHTDGLQIHDGGTVSGVTIEESIIGPGFTQGVILGDSGVNVNDVVLRDTLFINAAQANITAHSSATTAVKNWTIERVTAYGVIRDNGRALNFKGGSISITDSVFVDGNINIPNTTPAVNGNCQWNTTGYDVGIEENPLFTNAPIDAFGVGDYTIQGTACAGKGSGITAVSQLLNR